MIELPSDAFSREDFEEMIRDIADADTATSELQNFPSETNGEEGSSDSEGSGKEEQGNEIKPEEEKSEKEAPSEKMEEKPSEKPEEKPGEEAPAPGLDNPVDPDRSSFYQEVLSQERRDAMTGVCYPADGSAQISLDDLRYLHILHFDFEGNVKEGEIICNKSVSDDFLDIFYELYLQKYPITSVKLIDEFGGDDGLSMAANNTSAFNYRVVSGTDRLSKHALGVAIDINPQINPYVVLKNGAISRVSPENGTDYADRSRDFPGKIDKNDLCYKLFHEKGFFWGGDWKTTKDYQHFQKTD